MQLEHRQLSLQMDFRSICRSKRISYFATDFPALNSCLLFDTIVPKGHYNFYIVLSIRLDDK